MSRFHTFCVGPGVVAILLLTGHAAHPYEVDAHMRMTLLAVANGSGDMNRASDYLARIAGDGVTPLPESIALGGLQRGAKAEDDIPRFLNHFHEPLTNKGFRVNSDNKRCPQGDSLCGMLSLTNGLSSPAWAQSSRNDHSWDRARKQLFDTLTSSGSDARVNAARAMFETLGHQAHLIQDLASPPHARNDPHNEVSAPVEIRGVFGLRATKGAVDHQVTTPALVEQLAASGVVEPDPNLLRRRSALVSAGAPVPVANLSDSEAYIGVAPSCGQALGGVGISEFTGAHFFSLTTIPTAAPEEFPCPNLDAILPCAGPLCAFRAPDRTIDPIAVAEAPFGARGRRVLQLDKGVARANASILVPGAIGYSRALFDYFFRAVGKLEFAFSRGFLIRNASDDTLMNGEITIVVERGGRRQIALQVPLRSAVAPGEFVGIVPEPGALPILYNPQTESPLVPDVNIAIGDALFSKLRKVMAIDRGPLIVGVVFRGTMGPNADATEPQGIASRVCTVNWSFDNLFFDDCPGGVAGAKDPRFTGEQLYFVR